MYQHNINQRSVIYRMLSTISITMHQRIIIWRIPRTITLTMHQSNINQHSMIHNKSAQFQSQCISAVLSTECWLHLYQHNIHQRSMICRMLSTFNSQYFSTISITISISAVHLQNAEHNIIPNVSAQYQSQYHSQCISTISISAVWFTECWAQYHSQCISTISISAVRSTECWAQGVEAEGGQRLFKCSSVTEMLMPGEELQEFILLIREV